ncbi:protein C9orf135-like [Actinia tenebrosa]|uniref:Protein C9orf135-like n=1 Tax=Actinia tenebrosa TaxID=6105 RepID=A0A6P8IUN3_ACTTE|nr:protein C9orf135-like [Actinia tenebrosa]
MFGNSNPIMHIPDFVERKGSLFLRSDHMDYSRPTLVSNWHQAREAEPKDYELKNYEPEKRNLHNSTYNRILDITDGSLPSTTSHDQMEQSVLLKKDFESRETRRPMMDISTLNDIDFSTKRDTGAPDRGFGSVLPRHNAEHGKRYLDTTYVVDYVAPYPYEKAKTPPPEPDMSPLWKKCHSQFTDVDDYRHHGNNTWHNETGMYSNTDLKRSCIKPTDTIPERLS